eukprot:SAG22_NODE_38_length_26325_cov_107.302067_20_plen_235_part_00
MLHLSTKAYEEGTKPRHEWAVDWCAQMAVLVSRVIYTEDIGRCFDQLEEGNDNALKDYSDKCQDQLNNLSDLINGELSKVSEATLVLSLKGSDHCLSVLCFSAFPCGSTALTEDTCCNQGDRTKIITLVTIDVHARDVVNRLINGEATLVLSFEGSDHCLSFCFSAFPCGSTAITAADRCNQTGSRLWSASSGSRSCATGSTRSPATAGSTSATTTSRTPTSTSGTAARWSSPR